MEPEVNVLVSGILPLPPDNHSNGERHAAHCASLLAPFADTPMASSFAPVSCLIGIGYKKKKLIGIGTLRSVAFSQTLALGHLSIGAICPAVFPHSCMTQFVNYLTLGIYLCGVVRWQCPQTPELPRDHWSGFPYTSRGLRSWESPPRFLCDCIQTVVRYDPEVRSWFALQYMEMIFRFSILYLPVRPPNPPISSLQLTASAGAC